MVWSTSPTESLKQYLAARVDAKLLHVKRTAEEAQKARLLYEQDIKDRIYSWIEEIKKCPYLDNLKVKLKDSNPARIVVHVDHRSVRLCNRTVITNAKEYMANIAGYQHDLLKEMISMGFEDNIVIETREVYENDSHWDVYEIFFVESK